MKPSVVIAYEGFGDILLEQEVLSAVNAQVIHMRSLDTPQALETVKEADALMVTIQPVSSELIESMARCRVISRVGTGLDAIDIPAATRRGIWVAYVPDYSIDEVSTHALALLLAHARRLPRLIESTRQGLWDYKVVPPIERLNTQSLGVIGFGRIGRALALKARGIGLDVMAYDPYLSADAIQEAGVRPVDLETLLRASDYISLHIPLMDSTRNLIDAKALSLMKPTAFLINAARGGLIDEGALLHALRHQQIAGAAVDVLAMEPPPTDHPLLHEERAWVTPHVGWYSEAARRDVRIRAAEEVVRVWRGEAPRCPANRIDHR
ncbi:MAG: C-terminal binding protein [Chloroflexi bacterium]|nr:MAG: C-terminal binding protein [Chloroflexota bacterium]